MEHGQLELKHSGGPWHLALSFALLASQPCIANVL